MISLDWNMALRSSVWCLSPSGVFGGFLFWVPLSLAATVQRGAGASSLHYVLQFLCLSCRFLLPLVFAAIRVVFPVSSPFFSKFWHMCAALGKVHVEDVLRSAGPNLVVLLLF